MSIFRAIILGIVQGATEFLPVSSSGHLVIFPVIFRWPEPTLSFSISLHMGTFLAVLIYYFKDVVNLIKGFFAMFKKFRTPEEMLYLKLFWLLVIAFTPAALLGIFLKNEIEISFSSPRIVSYFFFFTALILFMASFDFNKYAKSMQKASFRNAIIVGLMQIFALFPGISRSGMTISGGVFSGLKREDAARFSFLLSIPTILGAGIFELKDALNVSVSHVTGIEIFWGFLFSFIVGIISIRFFFSLVRKTKFYVFAFYCVIIGFVGLLFA
jgi:undecaprenyl-diphosphatase